MTPSASRGILREEDVEFYERELATFVPNRVYDSHCHLWPAEQNGVTREVQIDGVPVGVGYAAYRELIDALHPGRDVAANFIPLPGRGEFMPGVAEWMSRHTAVDPRNRGELYIQPEDEPEQIREQMRSLKLHGLNCYHTSCAVSPTWEAEIPDYLPERIVKVADEEGWHITLHMVRSRCVADESNIHWIRHYCTTYPNMKLILAHSARGFQPAHNLEGLPKLRGLPNLYCDTSANCEPMAHLAIIRILGHEKLLYGSDFYVSHFRGRSVAAGDSFFWVDETSPVWGAKYSRVKPILVGLEHLQSLKWACWAAGLGDSAVEDIFWNNAANLFGVK